jgi:hypothetical protein
VSLGLCRFVVDDPLFLYRHFIGILMEKRGDPKGRAPNFLIESWSTVQKSAVGNIASLLKNIIYSSALFGPPPISIGA